MSVTAPRPARPPAPGLPLTAAYTRLAEVFPGAAGRELAGRGAPRGRGLGRRRPSSPPAARRWTPSSPGTTAQVAAGLRPAGPPGRRRHLRSAPLRLARLPADHRAVVPAPPGAAPPGRPTWPSTGPPGRMAVRVRAPSPACRTTRPPACPAPGSCRTRRRCGPRCGPRSPSTWSRCWTGSGRGCGGAAARAVGHGDRRDRRGPLVRRPPARRGAAGDARAGALLPGAHQAVRRDGAAFRELTGPDGEALPTRDRASCCLFYTAAARRTPA